MRMIELRDDARFTIEALAKLRIRGEIGGKDFDRDDPIQARIACAITSPMPPAARKRSIR